jgi:hypothetical protein
MREKERRSPLEAEISDEDIFEEADTKTAFSAG